MSISMTPRDNPPRKAVTIGDLRSRRESLDRITMLTCYDASFAALMDECHVDILLVGDSLGMVLQGHDSTLPVTIEDIAYHTRCVARRKGKCWLMADMPFGSYQEAPAQAYRNAALLMAAGAQMVKLEGGSWLAPTIKFLTERGIPVCAHLGLTPQSVHSLGGYRVQGRDHETAEKLLADARCLETAGADIVLVELIPSPLGKRLTESLSVPTIGIGAGPHLTGQVLVLHDILDVTPGRRARFAKNFLESSGSIRGAIQRFVREVKSGEYPSQEHAFEE
jgi:3-methyl-2-oxobutanoate hydroxymethyltransferase